MNNFTLNDWSKLCNDAARMAGWYCEIDRIKEKVGDNDKLQHYLAATFNASRLALIHSEVSEALEGVRKGIPDTHLPHLQSVDVELADTLIRIFDFAGENGIDLERAVREKFNYNQMRADHKPENRAKSGGKSI